MASRPHIDRLTRDNWNCNHNATHDVLPEEAEEVVAGDSLVRTSYKDRLVLTGPTSSGRMLTVVAGPVPKEPGGYDALSGRPPGQPPGAGCVTAAEGRFLITSQLKPSVDLGYPTEAHGRIPAFQSIGAEDACWDTHDVTEFEGRKLHPVEVTVGAERAERLTVRLDQTDRTELAKRARAKGVGPSTLARMWLKERLRQEAEAETHSR